jgi:amidase
MQAHLLRARSITKPMVRASLSLLVLTSLAHAQAVRSAPRFEVHEATIDQMRTAMSQGRLTSVELVDAYLARIAAYDAQGPELNALIALNPRARSDAALRDQERRAGTVRSPLHGVPILLKDNFDTSDLPTTGGLLALAGWIPRDDAFVVRRLREAGVVILGKTNMHELAHGITTVSSLGGQTRNPYDPTRCPGGSSGGTAAAIAASFAAVGWASDTCGSIRIPAAFNSLFGLRPTQGLVSRTGVIPLSHTQDIAGPLARTATDLAIALDVTVAFDSTDPAARALPGRPPPRFVEALTRDAFRGARLGVLTNLFTDADEEIRDTTRSAVKTMKTLGAEVIDVTIPGFDSLVARSGVVPFEMKFDVNDYLVSHGAPISSLREILDRGLFHEALEARYRARDTVTSRDSEAYRAALAKQQLIRARITALMDSLRLSALVYPTMRQRPVIIGDPQPGSTCQLSAASGLPALSMPGGFTSDGLPVGVELLGPAFSDARLVAMAFAFEQSTSRRRPPVTTPPLVNGHGPRPVEMTVSVNAAPGTARARFHFNPGRNELTYSVHVAGVKRERLNAVVLRRVDSTLSGTGRVIHRLSGPGATRAAGRISLSATDARALAAGRLVLSVFTSSRVASTGDARLEMPK